MSLPSLTKYELLARIGHGAAGSVYRARHREHGTIVAVKVIPNALGAAPTLLKRLEQEFLALNRLAHPGIVRGLDFGQDGTHHYLVLELLDGMNLGQRIERHGPVSENVALGIVKEVGLALNAAHEKRLLHRDVKPNNVMLTRDGRVKLTDFGIVKDMAQDVNLTPANELLGTPHYMAPEQFDGAEYASVRGDVYALAATLYHALSGEPPFPGKTWLAVLTRKIHHPVPSVRLKAPTVSDATDRALLRSMDPDPAKRPASCLELLAELGADDSHLLTAAMGELFASAPTVDRLATLRDRRRQTRHSARGTARYQRGGDSFIKAILVDASIDGVQLLVQERFDAGESLEVELLTQQGVPLRKRVAHVRWAAASTSELYYHLGCSWRHPLTYAEWQSFA